LVTLPLLILVSCCGDLVSIKSGNEPADDAAALRLAGITAPPLPRVVFRAFQGGLDDQMLMVIRFPKKQLSNFWLSSPWRNSQRHEFFPNKPGPTLVQSFLPKDDEPEWSRWMTSTDGIMSEATLPNVTYIKIYVALDQDASDAVGYIFWFET
jgi:hypothetical protein